MPRPNIGADLLQYRKEFPRPSDSGEGDNPLAGETLGLSHFRRKTRHQNHFARSRYYSCNFGPTLSRPDNYNHIDIPHLRSERRTQRPGRHAESIADTHFTIDDSDPEIGLDLPALQTIVEHEHAWIDRAPRVPGGFDTIGADNHRRDTREKQRLIPDIERAMLGEIDEGWRALLRRCAAVAARQHCGSLAGCSEPANDGLDGRRLSRSPKRKRAHRDHGNIERDAASPQTAGGLRAVSIAKRLQ
jgi:hypothetical protein